MNAIDMQNEGVRLTHEGRYVEAEKILRQVLEMYSNGLARANVLRDLADVVRRMGKSRWEEARALLEESLTILSIKTKLHPMEYAYSIHYMGRLERQVGEYAYSAVHLAVARNYIMRYLEENFGTPEERSQELYITLDYSSVLALNGRWIEAINQALKALILTSKHGTLAHKKRAFVLFLFALFPFVNLPFVRRAFFGGLL